MEREERAWDIIVERAIERFGWFHKRQSTGRIHLNKQRSTQMKYCQAVRAREIEKPLEYLSSYRLTRAGNSYTVVIMLPSHQTSTDQRPMLPLCAREAIWRITRNTNNNSVLMLVISYEQYCSDGHHQKKHIGIGDSDNVRADDKNNFDMREWNKRMDVSIGYIIYRSFGVALGRRRCIRRQGWRRTCDNNMEGLYF